MLQCHKQFIAVDPAGTEPAQATLRIVDDGGQGLVEFVRELCRYFAMSLPVATKLTTLPQGSFSGVIVFSS